MISGSAVSVFYDFFGGIATAASIGGGIFLLIKALKSQAVTAEIMTAILCIIIFLAIAIFLLTHTVAQ